jgi:hypothetical protein
MDFLLVFHVITARKVFIFLSRNVWFLETSDDDDDGVDAFLSTLLLSPRSKVLLVSVKFSFHQQSTAEKRRKRDRSWGEGME